MPHVAVVLVAVLVLTLGAPPRRRQMAVAVGVHRVAGTEDAGERAGDGRVGEEIGQFRDSGEDVVARIAFGCEDRVRLRARRFMERRREAGMHRHVAIDNEFLHLRIVEKIHLCRPCSQARRVV